MIRPSADDGTQQNERPAGARLANSPAPAFRPGPAAFRALPREGAETIDNRKASRYNII